MHWVLHLPLLVLDKLGSKIRDQYPDGKTLTEVVRLKFGKNYLG